MASSEFVFTSFQQWFSEHGINLSFTDSCHRSIYPLLLDPENSKLQMHLSGGPTDRIFNIQIFFSPGYSSIGLIRNLFDQVNAIKIDIIDKLKTVKPKVETISFSYEHEYILKKPTWVYSKLQGTCLQNFIFALITPKVDIDFLLKNLNPHTFSRYASCGQRLYVVFCTCGVKHLGWTNSSLTELDRRFTSLYGQGASIEFIPTGLINALLLRIERHRELRSSLEAPGE